MPQSPPLLTLLTDFGMRDAFVGTMKGVILAHCPEARLVDLTHEVAPGDIQAGALALRWAAGHFPVETVHLAVVDPGVGGTRRPIVLRTPAALFVGPDNGLLWPAAAAAGEPEAWEIDLARWDRTVSATFHGRDVFAPAAARLAAGEPPEAFGRPIDGVIRLEWPRPERKGPLVRGAVIYLDRFGNAITNLAPADLPCSEEGAAAFVVAGLSLRGPSACYGAAAPGEALVVLGSSGLYEVAVNQGSAASVLGLAVGSPVEIHTTGADGAEWERGNSRVGPE